MASFAPDIEWDESDLGEGVYRGREAVGEHLRTVAAALDLHLEEIELKGGDERMAMVVDARARGTASGAEVGTRIGYVFELREGELVRIVVLRDPEKALAALDGDDLRVTDAGDELKARLKAAWSMGEYRELARRLEPAARELADACAVSAGQEVLDVAAGDGNFAVVAAGEGASVVATDLAPGMVERGRRRTEAEGWSVEWAEADVEELPFEDARFDCVGSVFGAMFAPHPDRAAAEMFRVVRPGGTVGMAAWTPESWANKMFDVFWKYLPPRPKEIPQGSDWGREEVARERFEGLAGSIQFERRELIIEGESPEWLWEFQQVVPTNVAMRQALGEETWEQVGNDFVAFVRDWTGVSEGPVRIASDYLITVARKRG